MSNRVCVIDMPGLSRTLLHSLPADSAMARWAKARRIATHIPTFPAVTCSVQASLTTGEPPAKHGIVANGLPTFRSASDRELVDGSNFASYRREISFWEQSNQFLDVPRFWQDADGKSKYKTALLFFQNCMPGFSGALRPAADIVLTPKPDHGPDGKLTSLCWSRPADLVAKLFGQLGPFPLMNYWGPMASIASSAWIAKASAYVWENLAPTLQLVYIPHLDYDLQRFGPNSPRAIKAVQDAASAVEPLMNAVESSGGKIVLLSEYVMGEVNEAIAPNRILAETGLLVTRQTNDGDLIDYERSAAFAMADHQIAHVYCRDEKSRDGAKAALSGDKKLSIRTPQEMGLTHGRAGDLILLAAPNAWFDYRWWSGPEGAPAFAKSVDIHRKPGYDPLELFWDRASNGTSQNAALVRGSHGLADDRGAVLIADELESADYEITKVGKLVERLIG